MIMSMHLGASLSAFLDAFADEGSVRKFELPMKSVDVGVDGIAPIRVSAEERNRTAPFTYQDARFELRSQGASQNASFTNIVLNSCIAAKFEAFADAIAAGKSAKDVAREAYLASRAIVYNDNCWGEGWLAEAKARGLKYVESSVEAVRALSSEASVALFTRLGVLSESELCERVMVAHENYAITVEIEARCLLAMIHDAVLPLVMCGKFMPGIMADLEACLHELREQVDGLWEDDNGDDLEDPLELATRALKVRLETMEKVRAVCDELEMQIGERNWPFATYKELLFTDFMSDKPQVGHPPSVELLRPRATASRDSRPGRPSGDFLQPRKSRGSTSPRLATCSDDVVPAHFEV